MAENTYNSEFWRLRAEEARALAKEMKEPESQRAMNKVAYEYEQLGLQRAHEEAGVAFDASREALREKIGHSSPQELAKLNADVDRKWLGLQQAREKLDSYIRARVSN